MNRCRNRRPIHLFMVNRGVSPVSIPSSFVQRDVVLGAFYAVFTILAMNCLYPVYQKYSIVTSI